MSYYTVLCTCPSTEVGAQIAKTVLKEKLAACVNIIPNITSWYIWKEQLETNNEVLLIIKTKEKAYSKLEKIISAIHPYECPEIIALPIHQGILGYLQWINQTVTEPTP